MLSAMLAAAPRSLPRLTLQRSVLRAWRPGDVATLALHANNPKIAANLRDRFPHPYTEANARDYIERVIDSAATSFAIAVDGAAVGGVGVHPQDDIHRLCAEVGYWLAEPFWGRGIASEALRAATDWAFTALDLQRVFGMVFDGNPASVRVLEKAGFEREARLRRAAVKYGHVTDLLLYARLAPP